MRPGSQRASRLFSTLAVSLALLTACGNASSGPTTFAVSYHLSTPGGITFDSVKYEDAQGTLVKITAPPTDWSVAFSPISGSYVQASAWAIASTGGARATLMATWTASGVSTASDSSATTTTAPGAFTLVITRRRI
jgi:hypothetical protein